MFQRHRWELCALTGAFENLLQRLEYLVMVNFELHKQLCSYFPLEYEIWSLCFAWEETEVTEWACQGDVMSPKRSGGEQVTPLLH